MEKKWRRRTWERSNINNKTRREEKGSGGRSGEEGEQDRQTDKKKKNKQKEGAHDRQEQTAKE